jgi:hypothetical protein
MSQLYKNHGDLMTRLGFNGLMSIALSAGLVTALHPNPSWAQNANDSSYFAPTSEAEAAASVEPGGPVDPDAQVKEQIREAAYSRADVQQLPVTMDVKVFSTKTEDRELVLSGRLDTKALRLRKDGQRNLNNLTFVSAIFDQKDNLVQLQRGQAKLDASGRTAAAGSERRPEDGFDLRIEARHLPGA